ncbi:hypothetical protein ACJVDH_00080 [Pedobacter sp. AW1-32]
MLEIIFTQTRVYHNDGDEMELTRGGSFIRDSEIPDIKKRGKRNADLS